MHSEGYILHYASIEASIESSDMTLLRITDTADLSLMYDAASRRHGNEEWEKLTGGTVTKEIFIAYCIAQKFPTLGFEYDGKAIGGLVFDGNAAHLEVLPEYHGRWGLLWKRALAWIFSNKDPILVDIDIDNEKCQRFMARNNWPCVRITEKFMTYEMSSSAPSHSRNKSRIWTEKKTSDAHVENSLIP